MTPEEWIGQLAPFDRWNEQIILAAFALFGMPRDYLDIGSGTGAMVNVARKLGIEAFGFDQIKRPDDWLLQVDLRDPVNLGRQFDLVTCLETAEHIPADRADYLCDTIGRHVRPGGMLLFSAAAPGQGGDGHEHCQPATYWRSKLWKRDLNWKEERGYKLALAWELVRSPLNWLPANIQVFSRRNLPDEVYPAPRGGV